MKRISIIIDRLVVDGLASHERDAFLRSLDIQLRGMAAEFSAGSAPVARRVGSVDAGVLRSGAGPAAASAQVVRAVEAALTNGAQRAAGSGAQPKAAEGDRHG